MKKILFVLVAGLMVGAIIFGCSTEDPWSPDPSMPLVLVIVSAPDTTTAIPDNSSISFSWSVQGGSGNITGYQWYLSPLESDYGSLVNQTSATYEGLTGADNGQAYIFYARATDSDNSTATLAVSFTVADTVPPVPDTTAPTVDITESPFEGSFVATGTAIHFTWEGDDQNGNLDSITYQYAYPTVADSSEWDIATSVTIANVAAANPAMFYIRGKDQGDYTSAWDSVSFIIKPASILYVDDFQWFDAGGNVDMPKERDQKQFYRDALTGYAFAERDIARQGVPDSSDLVVGGNPVYSSIVWCSDSYDGTTSDIFSDSTTKEVVLGALRYYLENGGQLLLAGALTIYDMGDYIIDGEPTPAAGDFEFDWLGIDSVAWAYDYWGPYWYDPLECELGFTWAVKDTGTSVAVVDSMKIDVSKNGDQIGYAIQTFNFRDDGNSTSETIFTWGLNIDDSDCSSAFGIYGSSVGHVTTVGGTITVVLTFDTYSMPLSSIKQTFSAILDVFNE